jgi:hypothetical protein
LAVQLLSRWVCLLSALWAQELISLPAYWLISSSAIFAFSLQLCANEQLSL